MAFSYQGDQAHAKPDTRLLLDYQTSATADLSQRGVNMTASGASAYNTSDARGAVDSPRCVTVGATLSSTNTGILCTHGDNGNTLYAYRISVSGGNFVFADSTNGTLASIAVGYVMSKTYFVSWSTEANPLTTGASDAYRHLFFVQNVSTGEYTISRATSAAHASNTAHTLTVNGRWDGAAIQQALSGGQVDWAYVGARFHTTGELKGDWQSYVALGSLTGDERIEMLRHPQAALWANDAQFAGKQYAYAAAAHRQSALRLLSNAVNANVRSPPVLQDDLTSVYPAAWVMAPPDEAGAGWQICGAYLWRIPVPRNCNNYQVTVTTQLYDTGGAPTDLDLRVYSAKVGPGQPGNNQEINQVALNTSDDDTVSGPPTTHDLGLLRIARDDAGYTWIYVATRANGGVADASWRCRIWDVSLDPVTVQPDGNNPQDMFDMG